MFFLYGKGSPAAAGLGSIGIIETEAPGIETVFPMNFHSGEIHTMRRVHNKCELVGFKNLIRFLSFIKAQYIGKTGTAASLYTDAEKIIFVKTRFIHQPPDLLHGLGAELQG